MQVRRHGVISIGGILYASFPNAMNPPTLKSAPGAVLLPVSSWMRWLYAAAVASVLCAAPLFAFAQNAAVIITRPQAGETVHDNTGAVPVEVTVAGGVLTAGQRLRVLLDEKPYGAEQRAPAFVLQGVERGEHQLRVELVDAKGTVLGASSPVTFYMWQASSLFPSRKREAPPPK